MWNASKKMQSRRADTVRPTVLVLSGYCIHYCIGTVEVLCALLYRYCHSTVRPTVSKHCFGLSDSGATGVRFYWWGLLAKVGGGSGTHG